MAFKHLITLKWISRRWRYPCAAAMGICLGMVLVVARTSNAVSYLSESPETCINCHVMNDAYVSWQHGSHREVAVCNDCHVPASNPVARYAFKGMDGLKHSFKFTFRLEPQVLSLSHGAKPVVQSNCLRCHSDQVSMIRLADTEERKCWDCHETIHGSVRSLSASPREMVRPLGRRTGHGPKNTNHSNKDK